MFATGDLGRIGALADRCAGKLAQQRVTPIRVDGHLRMTLPGAERGQGDVADDRQEPGPRTATPIAVEVLQAADQRLLDDIFGVGGISDEPARQVVGGRKLGADQCGIIPNPEIKLVGRIKTPG